MSIDVASLNDLDRQIYDWLAANIGPDIVSFRRQLRWRIGWEAEIRVNGEVRGIYVRGHRGDAYEPPMTMHQESQVHGVMLDHGVPTARVYGMIEKPLVAIVMEMLPGQINLQTAADDATREKLRRQFIETLAKLHSIPVAKFGEIGLKVPTAPRDIAMNLYAPCIELLRKNMKRPFALAEFCARWLERNVPQNRSRAGFITADSGQFMFQGDKLTGLIDFEIAHVGDPAAEFAGLRVRDSAEPLGDIPSLIDYYEELTGDRIDKETIEYHTVGFASTNSMLMWPLIFDPDPETDLVAYRTFCVVLCRWSITAIAEATGVTLVTPRDPIRAPSLFDAAPRQLLRTLADWPGDDPQSAYRRESAKSLALFLQRWNDYGADILAQDLTDVAALTGISVSTADEADAVLDNWMRAQGPDQDARLLQHFHNWLHRQNFLLMHTGVADFMTGFNLQHIPPRHLAG